MKKLPGLRLRLVAVVLLAFVPFAAIVFSEARADHADALNEARSTVHYVAEAKRSATAEILERAQVALSTLAASPSVKNGNWSRLTGYFRRLKVDNRRYVNFALVDAGGIVRVSAVPCTGSVSLADRPYVRRALDRGEFGVGYALGRISHVPVIVCSYPTRDAQGRRVVLNASVKLSSMRDAFEADSLPPGAVATLFDESGTIIARQPEREGLVGRKLADGAILAAALHGESRARLEDSDGVRRLYAMEPVFRAGGSGLFVAVGLDEQQLLRREMDGYNGKIGALGALAVFVIGVSLGTSQYLVVRPLRSLRHVVGRLAAGDLQARTNLPPRGDEIGDLAAECDAMAERIERDVEALQRSEEHYRRLTELLPVGMYVLDESGTIRIANAVGLQLLGLDVLPAEGVSLNVYIAQPERRRVRRYFERAWIASHASALQTVLVNSTGGSTEVELAVGPYDDEQRQLLVVASDVTVRRAVEQAKSDFLSMVSHELRTPLTSIIGFTQLMSIEQYQSPESVSLLSGRILERAHHMTELVEDLLRVLQHDEHSFAGEQRFEDVRLLVESCIERLHVPDTHTVEMHAPKRLRPVVCDAKALRHAVTNLLANAIKFSPDGGTVAVSVTQADGRTAIKVTDQGVGVPEDARERIFGRFVQADMSSTRDFGGFGIGLFIVKQIAEAHGGSVSVEPGPERGSTFTLELAG